MVLRFANAASACSYLDLPPSSLAKLAWACGSKKTTHFHEFGRFNWASRRDPKAPIRFRFREVGRRIMHNFLQQREFVQHGHESTSSLRSFEVYPENAVIVEDAKLREVEIGGLNIDGLRND
jgi:hypothetical protein